MYLQTCDGLVLSSHNLFIWKLRSGGEKNGPQKIQKKKKYMLVAYHRGLGRLDSWNDFLNTRVGKHNNLVSPMCKAVKFECKREYKHLVEFQKKERKKRNEFKLCYVKLIADGVDKYGFEPHVVVDDDWGQMLLLCENSKVHVFLKDLRSVELFDVPQKIFQAEAAHI